MSMAEQNRVGFLYIRPSTASPLDAAEQERRVRQAAEAIDLICGAVLREKPMTARQRRAGLPMRAALLRRIGDAGGTVVVADLAALGRSLPDLVAVLAEIEASGSAVFIADAGGDSRLVTAADLETARRAYIREAIMEGRAKARARGVESDALGLSPRRCRRCGTRSPVAWA
jgi:DNA invertase Pin-like site-specific DNA recombinase